MTNPRVRILEAKLLSDNWYKLWRYTFEYLRKDGIWETQRREAYDRGNGATILLYNPLSGTVILTRQLMDVQCDTGMQTQRSEKLMHVLG